tara:strand:+ start:390 stop:623 length:234 start_codon:yes stop_codon:yes gene_type:complete
VSLLFWALLRSIIFSCIGNSFYKWFSKTKIGIWFDARLDMMLSKIMRKEDVAREKAGKSNGNQIDMFDSKSNRKYDS